MLSAVGVPPFTFNALMRSITNYGIHSGSYLIDFKLLHSSYKFLQNTIAS